jgi:glycosyltransferase involved in cell wall biosynthesis
MAGSSIHFIGHVSDEELATLYQNARALVFPGEEDFGLVMVESQAAGTPVIAYKKGGAIDIINDKVTGMLFSEQTKESLIKGGRV